jgi:hypothetical protein
MPGLAASCDGPYSPRRSRRPHHHGVIPRNGRMLGCAPASGPPASPAPGHTPQESAPGSPHHQQGPASPQPSPPASGPPFTCHLSPVTCHHPPVTCHHSPFTSPAPFFGSRCEDGPGFWSGPPFTVHPLRSTIHHSPVTCHLSPFTCHLSPVTCHHSPLTLHLSPVTLHPSRGFLRETCRRRCRSWRHPPTIHHSPVTCHHPPFTPPHARTRVLFFAGVIRGDVNLHQPASASFFKNAFSSSLGVFSLFQRFERWAMRRQQRKRSRAVGTGTESAGWVLKER